MPWVQKHHPTWLLWQAGPDGKPTQPARSSWNPGPILDFTNPQVRHFWMQHYVKPYLSDGFDGISWDGLEVGNGYGAVGHFDSHHHFVRMYPGSTHDEIWADRQTTALGKFLHAARTVKPDVHFTANTTVDCQYTNPQHLMLLLKSVDTILDEEAYTFWGNSRPWLPNSAGTYCKNRWLFTTRTYANLGKQGKWVVLVNEVPGEVTPYMTDTDPQVRSYLQWALANYLLVKHRHTYFWFGGRQQYGTKIMMQREELINLSNPRGDMRPMKQNGHIYQRVYAKGMALVNPARHKTFTVKLPHGRYKDVYGHHLNHAVMGPHSGLVLETVEKQ